MAPTQASRFEQIEKELQSTKDSIPTQALAATQTLVERMNDFFSLFSNKQMKMNVDMLRDKE